ncbi:MAG: hydrogenase iron-sulfur subunit [Anaerolineae bacterium]
MSEWQPKIVVFLCQWSLKSDLEWQQRSALPQGVHLVEVPCSGRINPLMLMSAVQYGADGILVVGCEPGRCHYKEGNYLGRRKFATLKSFLEYVGLQEKRVQFVWLSETDRGRLSSLVEDLITDVRALGSVQELSIREVVPCPIHT